MFKRQEQKHDHSVDTSCKIKISWNIFSLCFYSGYASIVRTNLRRTQLPFKTCVLRRRRLDTKVTLLWCYYNIYMVIDNRLLGYTYKFLE